MRTILLIIASIFLVQYCWAIEIVVAGETIKTLSERPFPPFNLADVRVITPTSSTSKCLGNLKDPICAAETIIACNNSILNKGCSKIRYSHPIEPDTNSRVEYIIMNKSRIVNNIIIDEDNDDNYDYKPVNKAFQIRYIERKCLLNTDFCNNTWFDLQITIGLENRIWRLGTDGMYIDHWIEQK